MARVRTVDFLPEIFQTQTNKQFLSATLDQLIQEPKFKKTQGFVGRKIGPGVNANDKYVVEPNKVRNDYQLEPGVIMKQPGNSKVQDAITYPGINDALAMQGALTNNADRLYTSDFYSWDPFVDFDKFVNFSQYYWLPEGPEEVNVSATDIPVTNDFTVTRENGVYTFSGLSGNNPVITLVRGGSYNFQVAQNQKETVNYRVSNQGTSAYLIDYQPNPTLTLVRGNTYVFNLVAQGVYPFWIKTIPSLGRENTYDNGVTRNGASQGNITFVVPQDAPDTLYYASEDQFNMKGQINIVDATPGTGPGFWIQTDPGVNGRIPATPNISSRDVLGVVNNGEDLGTVTFNVPLSTDQNFYYTLESIGPVDFVTNLKFNQINNQFLEPFIAQYGGIDGITNLEGRTIVFLNDTVDAEAGGWQITTQFDPVEPGVDNNGLPGTFDTTLFDQTTDIISQDTRYSVWRINYVTTQGGSVYMQLSSVQSLNKFQKFNVLFGAQYASTQWYRNAEGFVEQIPLLTAIKDVLFYQDGTDPEIFGQIRLIDPDKVSTLNIADIIGQKNYTSPNGVVFTNGLKVQFRGAVEPASYQNQIYYVEGVGTAIKLLPAGNFVTPETYTKSLLTPYDSTPYDVGAYDATLNAPLVPDYLTINRASPDLNAWSRSNRWFHIDVINASAEYNNTVPVLDNNFRAKRPILEFRAGTRLFGMGTQGKAPVNIIDFAETDALSNINGTTGYGVDGYTFIEGSRVIFANDSDPQVRNKIYQVTFITPDTEPPLIAQPIINLVPASDADVLINQCVVVLSGITQQGKSFYFDGVTWIEAQEKTSVNQAPLFDVYDADGVSFSNRDKYPSSTFEGSKLFSYAVGQGTADTVLGFPLRYLSLTNVGDIVFDNNLYTDTFVYVTDNVSSTENISQGFVRQYSDRVNFVRETGWQPAATKTQARQQFQFSYDGSPLRLDIKVLPDSVVPSVQVFVGSKFQSPDNYTVTTTDTTTTITFKTIYNLGDIIEVAVLSDQVSAQGFYEVPANLENNPFNVNSPNFTLGTVRTHYESIAENLLNLQGPINGANNSRDLGNLVPYGTTIVQQSSPLTLAGFFMRNQEFDIFKSLEFNDREYIKFKSRMLDTVIRQEWGNFTASQILDSVITELSNGKTDINPFYWSDMLPAGTVSIENTYTVTPISDSVFDTVQTYNFRSANYQGLLVYLNNTLLTIDYDYTVAIDGPRITILVPLAVGDRVTIREFTNTAGNFVPNTPTKLGLYPAFKPSLFLDTNYVDPTAVIQGHDGSITVAFGDIRDDVLLEFEKRIFNNLKTKDNPIPLTVDDVIPGYFRTTDYSQTDITNILSESFLTWVGWNKLDYKTQDYNANNPFTYNYSQAGDKEKNQPLLGAWRGIYRYFYDTLSPNTTPWEMLGLSQKPSWWEERYGPAPYTSDNLVLWDDLEAGYVADPLVPYYVPEYARPGLVKYFIPTGTEGQLLAPIDSVVGPYDPTGFRKSWVVGDGGPVEASWWTSSSYPFAVMRLLALTRPAEFFSLFADRDLYKFDAELGQYLYNRRYRLDANGIQVYGNGVSKASYIDWIVDYNQQLGRNSTTDLEDALASLDVRLCYRMASYSDKRYLKIFTERSSPDSVNSSLLLPDESYNLLLYKNTPFDYINYSSVIVQKTDQGFAVFGYNNAEPYFEIFASRANGNLQTIEAGGTVVRVPRDYSNNLVQVPYGFVFANATVVVDFLLSYGRYLESQGIVFDNVENGYTLNWHQMAQEFLYWNNQGWGTGSIINLNPCAARITAERPGAVVDSIVTQNPENMVVDQNGRPLDTKNLVIERLENNFSLVSTDTSQSIAFVKIKFVNYEHLIILDNVSIFNDLIYNPNTGARQNRINLVASTTTEWNGTVDAQGFILNEDNVQEWKPNKKYPKGEVVLYKNTYWSAQTIVQPKIEFDYNDWVKSDWTKIERGLLPNLANKADQLANSYNTQVANLESDNDLLSYGLIGFRPRQYMTALNLDDVSQVNLYQQFLGTKGTVRAAEIFTGANLGKETADYQIYENWAVQRGIYGANANRSYYELRLNEALLQSDPATIQVVLPQEPSVANQAILLSDVWKQSYKLTSPDILPTTLVTPTDTALPSAGYVNIDDVDITVFSLDDPSNIAANLDKIGIGTRIWVAKSNSYDWNIYRCNQVPGRLIQVSDNLDGTSQVTFTQAHNLSRGDLVVVRYFNSNIDGVYRVLNVPSVNTITVAYSFTGSNQTSATGSGLTFFLQTMRVAQASDILNLPYSNSLIPGALAWVDNNGFGQWEVLEKQEVFSTHSVITPKEPTQNAEYGASVSQATDLLSALVGAPAYGSSGAVYPYLRGANEEYVENPLLVLATPGTSRFGCALDIGGSNWSVIGANESYSGAGYAATVYRAPASNAFELTQLLVAPDQNFNQGKFGTGVTISQDERWMFIGAPGNNSVYAYSRVDVEEQLVRFTTNGQTAIFNFASAIQVDSDEQIVVTLNNSTLVYGVDYSVTASDVVFPVAPAANQLLIIRRRQAIQLDHQVYYNVEQDSTSGSGTGATFTVDRTRGVYFATLTAPGNSYNIGDTLTIDATTIGGGVDGVNDLVITVTSVTSGGITGFNTSGSGVSNTSIFPLDPYLYTATDIYSISVYVNGVIQRPHIDYSYNTDSSLYNRDIVFTSGSNPPSGATIFVTSASHWKYVDRLSAAGLPVDAEFGYSVTCTTDGRQIAVGATNDDAPSLNNAGSVYVFDRSVTQYTINTDLEQSYSLPAGTRSPVAVKLNGTFLTPYSTIEGTVEYYQSLNGQFTVDFDSLTVTLLDNVTLAVGDILEIESNIFKKVQKLNADTLFDESQFGYAVDICVDNDELYVGAPQDGSVLISAGSVERFVNQAAEYGIITATVANPSLTAGDTIRINNQPVAVPSVPNNTVQGLAGAINNSGIPNVTASVSTSGLLTISIMNLNPGEESNKLLVSPGLTGTAFENLGLETYVYTQTIVSPNPAVNARFGASLSIDTDSENLVVGAPGGDTYQPVTFDNNTTYFDDRSTTFFTERTQSGAVYTYDYLPSASVSLANPGKFVFGQQIYDDELQSLDQFGASVNYVNKRLAVGSPGSDVGTSLSDYGRVVLFQNPTNSPSWTIKHIQQPVVDVHLLNSVFMYDRLTSNVTSYLDFINPLQGKILGVARQDIDYVGAVDPANYNTGPVRNTGTTWGFEHVGEIWWDTNSVRFIDPNQDDIVYASRRWGQVFPGSRIDIYQWIESDVPPANYTGPGVPLSVLSYTTKTQLNNENIFTTKYYFWVRNISTVATTAGKKLSTTAIASYIENPRSSGIAYLAPLNASTVAIYNSMEFLSAADTILHIEYDRVYTDANVHVEYELVAQERADSFISPNLYLKLQDSFCGVNSTGALVPDPTLGVAERYGVEFRPRQSMFADRFSALKNYLQRANAVLKNYPISETRKFNLLNSSEPEPSSASGAWNKRVANLEELSYQNLAAVPYGYKYLVVSDSSQNGLWTIYEVVVGATLASKTLGLIRVQNYDTKRYWNYIDWYQPGYNSTINPVAEVPVYSSLSTLTNIAVGASVKVTSNSQGKFEIYQRTLTGWTRVGLQDGTIEFKAELWDYAIGRFGFDVEVFDAQYFDQEPVIETRKIIQAINEELFVDDLLIERNRSLMLVFNYVLSEFEAPSWLVKTSLVDVDHRVRDLVPYQIYRQDNQDFVIDYIQEVKPYHVQIREFNLTYDGIDAYAGMLTDFDLPAYWDTDLEIPQFVSPILLPYTKSTATGTGTPNANSDVPANSTLWQSTPWNEWYNNYLLALQDVEITNPGSGYTVPPEVVIVGDSVEPAELTAIINSAGQVVGVNIVNPGSGYTVTPVVTFVGGNGTGARGYPILGNDLVRSIKTVIKYDRYQYSSPIVEWQPNESYTNGTQVRYLDQVWSANSGNISPVVNSTFDPEQWDLVNPSTLSGVDRTMGLYVPTVNQPGLELPLLIDGVDYPGVQVMGPGFNQNSGYDVGNYDINPYDNISYGPEGRPTYDPAILDAIYESAYLDAFLGTRPTDINVDGGAYIDTYSSHAPEELVPGSEFDTLDLRVYTTPGADWARDGHGFRIEEINYELQSTTETLSWANIAPYPVTIIVHNQTTGLEMYPGIHYTTDWQNQTITTISGISVSDLISIDVYELGGGNQLFKQNYNGADIGNAVTIPVQYSTIQQLAVFVNGVVTTDYVYTAGIGNTTDIEFGTTYTINDLVSITAIGPTTIDSTTVNYSWSTPQVQYITADGGLSYTLTNSTEYTNSDNLIVTINGRRVRTSAGIEYYSDGSTDYALPERLGFSQALISPTEVRVYLDDVPQILGVDFTVEDYDPFTPRSVMFTTVPPAGKRILICVTTNTQAWVTGNTLSFNPAGGFVPVLGDVIAVTTWNDTRQQNILTQVFVGPIQGTALVEQSYDSTDFDSPTLGNPTQTLPGLFDYSEGQSVTLNSLILERTPEDTSRLWVTLNGRRIYVNEDFTVVGNEIVLAGSYIMQATDIVMVTEFTNSVAPEAMAFRIFQDMRGVQATYRITPATTTQLAQPLTTSDDIIYVDNAGALSEPNLTDNVWGILTINGERIMYRNRDTINNTISGLRRGTAGTAVADHAVESEVYDMGRGNLLPEQFQNYIVSDSFLGDGSTTLYVAQSIDVSAMDSTTLEQAVEVYVGGTLQTTGYTIIGDSPVQVLFDSAPSQGVEVTVLVRRGVTWYAPGAGTPSNGVALQDTNTQAARFLRGL